ncbi:MAG: hypothetical protein IPK78_08940 [Rhodospirillales bacterium]|nr:hypothetical protein [Rhodospirillales bacterium]
MSNPLTVLITLQLTIINRCVAVTRDMLDLYLSLQPMQIKAAPISTSRSLVPLNQPTARRSR